MNIENVVLNENSTLKPLPPKIKRVNLTLHHI